MSYTFARWEGAKECTVGPTPGAGALLAWCQANRQPPGRSLGVYNCRDIAGTATRSLHGEGRALDWGMPLGPEGGGIPEGHEVVDLLGSNAEQIGVQAIIYDRTIWSARSPDGRPYEGRNPHYDHLHIELTWQAANELTLATLVAVLGGRAERPSGLDQTPPTSARLRRGSRGEAVRKLQHDLIDAGFDPGPVDGDFGAGTEAAVKQFQEDNGLAVDGVAGPRTLAALAGVGSPRGPGGLEPEHPTRSGSAEVSPISGQAVDWPTVTDGERMRYVMKLLVDHYGYPVNGAAGVVGNLWAESGVIPQRIEGSRPETPLRAKDFAGTMVDFTPEQVMQRDRATGQGPARPGVGLAQWTSPGRRAGLFAHSFDGVQLSADVLFHMDAQVDYLAHELQQSYPAVRRVVTQEDVSVDDACDEIVYSFEIPGSILDGGRRLPRTDPPVQKVFQDRRAHAERALREHERAGT